MKICAIVDLAAVIVRTQSIDGRERCIHRASTSLARERVVLVLIGVANAEIESQRIGDLVRGVCEHGVRIGVDGIVSLERGQASGGVTKILRRRVDGLLFHVERTERVLESIPVEERAVQAQLLAERMKLQGSVAERAGQRREVIVVGEIGGVLTDGADGSQRQPISQLPVHVT